jgi:energy-coupling factor transport system ATP-binding protein
LPNIIEVHQLSFRYRGASDWVLRGVDLAIGEGEFIVLTGPSGCGKSTLALVLTGIASRLLIGETKGSLTVDGIDPLNASPTEMSSRVGIVLQNPETQLVTMTVREELAFGPENLAVPPAEIERRIDDISNRLGIGHLIRRNVSSLSGGEKQTVAIASMLTLRPRLLILDEITSMLDPSGIQAITELIERMQEQYNITTIAIDHRLDWAVEISDRVMVMDKGEIVLNGSPYEIFSNKEFARKIGFRVPQVTAIAYGLTDHGRSVPIVPITLEEGTDTYSSMLKKRKIQ